MVGWIFALLFVLNTGIAAGYSLDRRMASTYIPFGDNLTHGTACNSTTLNAAITAIGTDELLLLLPPNDANGVACTWTISANVTVPENILVLVPTGVHIVVQGGATLTFQREPTVLNPKNWISGAGDLVINDKVWGSRYSFLGTFAGYVESGCLHGTSGTRTTAAFSCTAVSNWSIYFTQTSAAVTYPATAGVYWLIAYQDTTTAIAGWTRQTGTRYLYQASATQPGLPTGAIWLARVTNSGSALTAVHDMRRLKTTDTCPDVNAYGTLLTALASITSTPQTLCVSSLQIVTGAVTIPSTTTLTLSRRGGFYLETGSSLNFADGSTFVAGNHQIFYGPGTVSMAPSIPINPVWWTESGSGSDASPWGSTDGSAGAIKAFAAVRQYGKVAYATGTYSMSAGAGVNHDDFTLDLGYARIIPTTAGMTLFNLNSGAVLSDLLTVNHTITVRGGYIDSGSELSYLNMTAFYAPRTRNVLFDRVRFRGIGVCINAPIMDTLIVRDSFFRRCGIGVYFPNVMTGNGSVPQDIWIHDNAVSSNVASYFVAAESIVDSLNVFNNGAALNSNDGAVTQYFVRAVAGTAIGESANMRIYGNATEQATLETLVQVYCSGDIEQSFFNIAIYNNSFGSSDATGISLNCISGSIAIHGNEFPSNSQKAIDIDTVRADTVIEIRNNQFFQRQSAGGICFELSNVAGGAAVVIGRNVFRSDVTPCTYTYPVNSTTFEGLRMQTHTLTSASTITISPWDNLIHLTGTAQVNTINGTWRSHCATFITSLTAQLMDDIGNLQLAGDGPNAEHGSITVCFDGDIWREVTRSHN
jgi:hypothetical protein